MGSRSTKSHALLQSLIIEVESNPDKVNKKFNKLFKLYDIDKSGSIDRRESKKLIHDFLRLLEREFDEEMVEYATDLVWHFADVNHDGVLSAEELMQYFLRVRELSGKMLNAIFVYGDDATVQLYENLTNEVAFERLLMEKEVLNAFFKTLESDDVDQAVKYFVFLCETHGVVPEFLFDAIEREIAEVESPDVLFRGKSIAGTMFKYYAKMNGMVYLQTTLTNWMEQLVILPRPPPDSEELQEESTYTTQLICNRILTTILKNDIPSCLKEIFHKVKLQLEQVEHFPVDGDTVYSSLGALFFLRFVVPSIFAPHTYGILPDSPSLSLQKILVVISKIIHQIGTLKPPGKREEFLEPYAAFIQNNFPKVKQFFDEKSGIQDAETVIKDTPPYLRTNSLCALYVIFAKNQDKIVDHIVQHSHQPEQYLTMIEMAMKDVEPPSKLL